MNTRLFILSLLILTLLFGCVLGSAKRTQRSKIAERAKTELVGMSKKDILSCAGEPLRSHKSENLEFFTYIGGGGYNLGKVDKNGNVSADSRYCEVTIVFEDNKVTDVSYAGQTGGRMTKDEQCAFIVEKCLSNK